MSFQIDSIELKNIVANPMRDMNFSEKSVWKNQISIQKQNTLIVAPSGTGKTSLLAFIYGLRSDYQGIIQFNSTTIGNSSLKWWSTIRQKNLSVIFQDIRLIPHLTVGENFILKNNLTKFKTIEEIKAMCELLGISQNWNQKCGTLSFGQQQRVGIIRSLLQPMDFLLADEPFSHLDEVNTQKAKDLILSECTKQKSAILFFSLGDSYGINFQNKLILE